jgi:hypothetical protein
VSRTEEARALEERSWVAGRTMPKRRTPAVARETARVRGKGMGGPA